MDLRQRSQLWISLDDGPSLRVIEERTEGPEYDYIRSRDAVMPDPNWVFVDSYGHEHRWASTDRRDGGRPEALPSLVRTFRHVDCDGTCPNWDCDGYDVPEWHCVLCGDQVEPGCKPDYQARTTGIPVQRTAARFLFRVEGDPPGHTWQPQQAPFQAVLSSADAQQTCEAFLTGEVEWSSNEPMKFWLELRFGEDPGVLQDLLA